jgi:acyl-CoA dehydrogenase
VPLAETLVAAWTLTASGLPVPRGAATILSQPNGATVVADDDHWRVNGNAERVPFARGAHTIVVVDTSSRLVAAVDAADCVVREGVNLAGEPRDEVTFDSVTPIAAAALPSGSSGDEHWQFGALMRTAQIAGALQRVLELTLAYVAQREQFGRPIGAFQAVQQQIACLAGLATAVQVAFETAAEASSSGDGELAVAAAKAFASRASGAAVTAAHQVHGAIGLTAEYQLQLYTRRLLAWRDEFGNETHWSATLGRQVAAADTPLWPLLAG